MVGQSACLRVCTDVHTSVQIRKRVPLQKRTICSIFFFLGVLTDTKKNEILTSAKFRFLTSASSQFLFLSYPFLNHSIENNNTFCIFQFPVLSPFKWQAFRLLQILIIFLNCTVISHFSFCIIVWKGPYAIFAVLRLHFLLVDLF